MPKRLLLSLGAAALLVLLFVGIGFLLPAEATVSRSLLMSGSATQIHNQIRDPRRFQEWSPWADRDVQMEVRYEGAERGPGAVTIWSGSSRRDGRLEITGSEPGAYVYYEAELGFPAATRGRFEIAPEKERKRVTWRMTLDFGNNLPGRYMGLVLGFIIGPEMDRGLMKLKNHMEGPASPFPDDYDGGQGDDGNS